MNAQHLARGADGGERPVAAMPRRRRRETEGEVSEALP